MAESLHGIIYGEAQRALALQPVLLNELRSRTGILFAVANGVTGFLGAQAIKSHGVTALAVVALSLFGASATLCLAILSPLWRWSFSENPKLLIRNYCDSQHPDGGTWTTEQVQRDLALHMENDAKAVRDRMKTLHWLFFASLLFLGSELVVWLVMLDD